MNNDKTQFEFRQGDWVKFTPDPRMYSSKGELRGKIHRKDLNADFVTVEAMEENFATPAGLVLFKPTYYFVLLADLNPIT
jgi:hypothetical protein